jgi:hypothetical protein
MQFIDKALHTFLLAALFSVAVGVDDSVFEVIVKGIGAGFQLQRVRVEENANIPVKDRTPLMNMVFENEADNAELRLLFKNGPDPALAGQCLALSVRMKANINSFLDRVNDSVPCNRVDALIQQALVTRAVFVNKMLTAAEEFKSNPTPGPYQQLVNTIIINFGVLDKIIAAKDNGPNCLASAVALAANRQTVEDSVAYEPVPTELPPPPCFTTTEATTEETFTGVPLYG